MSCLSVTIVSRAKTAEQIEMPFERWTRVTARNNVLDGVMVIQNACKGALVRQEEVAHCEL